VATTTLLAEIRVLGYTGSPNLLVRYLEQGRAEESLVDPSVRRLTSWIMTDPDHLAVEPGAHRDKLTALCPEMTALTGHVTAFAKLLAHHEHHAGEHAALQEWIEAVSADDLPALHGFVRGLVKDRAAVQAGLDLPYKQRNHRGHQQQDETPQTPDLRPRGLRPPPPAHPAQLTLGPVISPRSPATKILSEPNS
jgi:hypothetical protein